MADEDVKAPPDGGVSRRDFLKLGGITLSVPMVAGPRVVDIGGKPVEVHGPGKVPVTLNVNGKQLSAEVEPRVTLLDALRDHFDLTGAKRVCDRAECGACTVLLDDRPVYACSVLAIDAQGRSITTVEGITSGDALHPVQHAFVANDAQQCGFCTPGFVISATAFLRDNPEPSDDEIRVALSGNLCRCTGYQKILEAVEGAAALLRGEDWQPAPESLRGSPVPGTPEPER